MIADLTAPLEALGDRYGVETRIVTWEEPDVLKIPDIATFRTREGWRVFVVGKGRARWRAIEIAHRNQTDAEILSGISVGELVILYPPNQLREGVGVRTQ